MRKAEKTMKTLESTGWIYDRQAMVKGYRYAGNIGCMVNRKGYEYCRVYDSVCKNVRQRGGWWIMFQRTYVYKRPLQTSDEH